MAVGLFLVAFRPGQAPPQAQQATDGAPPGTAVMGSAERHDTSPPLAEMVPQHPDTNDAPVVIDNPSTSVMPSPLVTFEGIGYSQTGYAPAAANGDIGPNHYIQTVNAAFAIWDRSGKLLSPPANINTLWKDFGGLCETTNRGQPIVLYDHLADRWLISQWAHTNSGAVPTGPFYQCIAISKGADPLGAWHRYAFRLSDSKVNDHPKLGVWPDGYYMSADQLVYPGGTWGGAGVWVFERERMLQGQAAGTVSYDLQSVSSVPYQSLLPSDLDGPAPPAGTPNYFVSMLDGTMVGGVDSVDRLNIWEFRVNWNTGVSTFGLEGRPNRVLTPASGLTNFEPMCEVSGIQECIPQPGTNQRLDVRSERLMFRLQYRRFGTLETLVLNHTVDRSPRNGPAAIRWYELRKATGGSFLIHQQGTYSPDSDHRWMGSIAMNAAGTIAMGFSVASGSTFPSIRYTARLNTDPLGSMSQGEGTLWAGAGSQTGTHRWGDYSMLAVDPVDDNTFWYTNQYYSSTSPLSWRTRIGNFRFGPSTPMSPQPPNDDFSNAAVVGSTPYTNTVDTTNATGESIDQVFRQCDQGVRNAGPPPKSVWYRYTPVSNGTVSANTTGSNFYHSASAYTVNTAGNLQLEGCFDKGTITVTFPVIAGKTYYFLVIAENANVGGTLVFNLAGPAGQALVPVSIDDVTMTEGDSGQTNVTLTVSLAQASSVQVSVNFATADETATGGGTDYATRSGTLTFAPGSTSSIVTIPIVGDTIPEEDETLVVNLTSPVNATLADGQGVVTIRNDDVPPAISVTDVTVTEGDAGTTSATLTVSLSRTSSAQVSVSYTTANATATAGADYSSRSGTLTIPAGSTSATLSIPILGDTTVEGNETFVVNLSSPLNATLADAQGVVTILNDDSAPAMALDVPAAGARVRQNFVASGWAVDRAAASGSGVDAVHVWVTPSNGNPVFVGRATLGGARPDIGAVFGSQFASSGFSLQIISLPPGQYRLTAYARSVVTGTFNAESSAEFTISVPVSDARLSIDGPTQNSTVVQPFLTGGWAVDLGAESGSGVDAVHVWAFPVVNGVIDAAHGVFVAEGQGGGQRSDVGAVFGAQFATSGFTFVVQGLPAGEYELGVYARSTVTGTFNQVKFVRITIMGSTPLMSLDGPVANATIAQPFLTGGWAVDRASAAGSGVDAVHVWAFPLVNGVVDPSRAQFVAQGIPGGARPDVGAVFGSQFTNSGFTFVMNGLPPGPYVLGVYARSTVSGTFNQAKFVTITIQ